MVCFYGKIMNWSDYLQFLFFKFRANEFFKGNNLRGFDGIDA